MILNPFQQHAALLKEYEGFTGGGASLATLTFPTLLAPVTVPVTHTKIDADFVLQFGKSATTTVERAEFRSSLIPSAQLKDIVKGLRCTLQLKTGVAYDFQLWAGGLMEGGEIFRFMLVSANYRV